MVEVKEGSTSRHSIAFFNKEGAAIVPSSLRYRLTDGNGGEVEPWSSWPADSTAIVIDAESNKMFDFGPSRYLTVEATYDGGKITAEASYTLTNLKGIDPDEPAVGAESYTILTDETALMDADVLVG
jgi:hypothetical protein